MPKLQRTTFKASRAAQYVEARALTAMTGQAEHKFADVVTKELMDNALDACEASGVAPEINLAVEERFSGGVAITVKDNASGIPQDTVHDALNFDVLVSDKAAYRSPTRGAQGNALKTVFGIPYALDSEEPVVVESKGTRHEALVWKDPAGQLRVQCDDSDLDEPRSYAPAGTSVMAHVPSKGTRSPYTNTKFDPQFWARAFSLFNPHSKVKIRRSEEDIHLGQSSVPISEDSYLPTRDPQKCYKYMPTDPTSPHWYDADAFKRLVYSHIGHHRHEGADDLRLREFVRQFKGLSATTKAKAVCGHFPEIKTLKDFEDRPETVRSLLRVMKSYSDAPSHATLGSVGKEHFRARFEQYYGDLHRFDYKKITGELHTGMPYVVEFAIAEPALGTGELFTAVNYSPTFSDPLEDVRFTSETIRATGLEDFLEEGFVHPVYLTDDDPDPPNTAVAIHIITPAPLFLDQGKTRLEGFTDELEGPAIGKAMFSKIKPYYKEGKRRIKGKRSAERKERSSTDKEMSLKDATALVLEEAWRHTTGNGQLPVGARRLFYAVRSRIPLHTSRRFSPDKGYDYFSQKLLPDYQKQRVSDGLERLAGVYYDPRGKIHEAHSGRAVDLGTRDVDAYEFPPYTFNKLLYVEKRGQVPLLQAARLAERYDMALVTEAGFSTVAARTLLTSGSEEKYAIFCLHDCDYPGYNILRTLREETERMPGHSLEVFDIGLTVEQVEAMGKTPETYTRTSKVPSKLMPLLSEREEEWFVGEYLGKRSNKDAYSSKRFELDDLTAPEVIEHIEGRLKELGVEPKVIPPEEVLAEKREQLYRAKVGGWVDEIIAEILLTDELKAKMVEEFEERFKLQGARAWIETQFEQRDNTKSWRDALRSTLQRAYDVKHKRGLKEAVRGHIRQTVADDAVEDE